MTALRKRPLRLGHRGAPLKAKENTLESFRLALEAGLDGVELDVWPTRDGVFAVRHDPDTPLGPVFQVDYADLKAQEPDLARLEEEGKARRLLALGLDGLIGDRPEVLLPLGG
ncbi:glycerophosphodiester phosphodiesterase [Thermus thermophilus]|uniref:glycerophosphodiester phosphodiesterase n=1 Tax=Thermus thermophilus TaxID=274 RepID=UPI001C747181|nr:glycerophosphodiester phosphodiesterase [Thermus thermophilus]BCZ90570.1 hypothetical protein TthAA22_23750 [Thermus thermophilus]